MKQPAPSEATSAGHQGFVLITALLLLLLLSLLVAALHLRLWSALQRTEDLQHRLRSFVLAENGIEVIRSLLPSLELESVLVGENGLPESLPRTPLALSEAVSLPLDQQALRPDDGVPFGPGIPFAGGRLFASDTQHTLIRISNNPEESSYRDDDGVVLVRSLGVVRARPLRFLPGVVNVASLIEARFRVERAFLPPSALTLVGSEAELDVSASNVRIEGGGLPAAVGVDPASGTLLEQMRSQLHLAPPVLFSEQEPLQDATQLFLETARLARLLRPDDWSHFLQALPGFTLETDTQSLTYLPQGGVLQERYTGLLVSGGPLRLPSGSHFTGLLIQIGEAGLTLGQEAGLTGAVWIVDPGLAGQPSRPLRLKMESGSQIRYDPQVSRRALWLLPPTQLGWRVLSPGME